MTDLRDRFRELDRLPAPDLRGAIRTRVPTRPVRAPVWQRVAASAIAIAIAGVGLMFGARAFLGAGGEGTSRPGAEPAEEVTSTFEYKVPSPSMLPTFRVGQVVEVDRSERNPERGAVILFANPHDLSADSEGRGCPPESCFMKRVIGLPGETIEIRNGRVFINDDPLSEPYALLDSSSFGPVTVEPDRYFVMGDNRSNSSDSRSLLGTIPKEAIAGTVVHDPS